MAERTDTKTASPEREEATQKRSSARSVLLAGLVLLALAAAAYFARQAWQDLAMHEHEHEHGELTALSAQSAALKQNIAALQAQQEALVKEQAVLQQAFAGIYQSQRHSDQQWTLAEVEYLLLIAARRLALEADMDSALAAMQAADSRLEKLPDPALLAVRRQLSADMNALRAVSAVDIPGLALYLADLIERAGSLPLKRPQIPPEPAAARPETALAEEAKDTKAPWWQRLAAAIWQELKSVIVISHDAGERAELLLPQQSFYLRQNLRLQLETARYAVLQGDTVLLHSSITTITAWLDRYFAVSDKGVSNIMEALAQMRTLELAPKLPDISASLEALRSYIRADARTPDNGAHESGETAQ